MKYQRQNNFDHVFDTVQKLIKTVKTYNGVFTLLTHNTTVSDFVWKGWAACYERILRTQEPARV